jgi:predicted transcriptional regulator
MGNQNRSAILSVVRLMPGLHLRQMERLLGLSFSTVRHHVKALAVEGDLVCVNERGFSRLYPTDLPPIKRSLCRFGLTKASRAVLTALLARDGQSNKALASVTGLPKSTVSETLRDLELHLLVLKSFSMTSRPGYALVDPKAVAALLEDTDVRSLSGIVTRFIDVWDF